VKNYANYVNVMTLNNSGNVGIGTTAPSWKLDVYGVDAYTRLGLDVSTQYVPKIQFGSYGSYIAYDYVGAERMIFNSRWSASHYEFRIADVEKVRIDSSGNVGIGTTSPSSFKLQVAGNAGPDADNSYDLGSSSLRWKDIYMYGTLYDQGITYYLNPAGSSVLNTVTVSGDIILGGGGATETNRIRGDRILYAADETNVTESGTSYVLKKRFSTVFHSTRGMKPRYVNVIARLGGAATPYLNFTISGCGSLELSGVGLKDGGIDVSSCSDTTVYQTDIYLKSGTSGSTVWNDVIEVWFVE
jgi:hypothetical protein